MAKYNLLMLLSTTLFRIHMLVLAAVTVATLNAQSPQYVQGPRGGCYEITKSGGKKSVNRSLCADGSAAKKEAPAAPAGKQTVQQTRVTPAPPPPTAPAPRTIPPPSTVVKGNRTYVKGPRGGCYYVTASGRKEYVDRSMCQ